jgi:hypothetical protein
MHRLHRTIVSRHECDAHHPYFYIPSRLVPDDWLALYPADEDPLALTDDFVNWMYSCGNKQCRGVVQSSFYSFQAFVPGTYRIHLIRNKDTQPYTAYASTAAFTVVENRLDCPSEVDPGLIPEIDP